MTVPHGLWTALFIIINIDAKHDIHTDAGLRLNTRPIFQACLNYFFRNQKDKRRDRNVAGSWLWGQAFMNMEKINKHLAIEEPNPGSTDCRSHNSQNTNQK